MKNFIVLSLLTGFMTSCGIDQTSQLSATDRVEGKKVDHWYQSFSEEEFLKFHSQRADELLGQSFEFLPDTLRGLLYMDGNPLEDQTINFRQITVLDDPNEGFYWDVTEPLTYTWFNVAKSHEQYEGTKNVKLRYVLKWKDCPKDVVKERRQLVQGIIGSGKALFQNDEYDFKIDCSKEDKQYATITPVSSVLPLPISIPSFIASFDMYLKPRPSTQDFWVWERRSQVVGRGYRYHRYQLTQVMNEYGEALSSYNNIFIPKIRSNIEKRKADFLDIDKPLIHICFDGEQGCS